VTGLLPLRDGHPPPPEALAALHALCFTMPRPWSAAEFAALIAHKGAVLVCSPEGLALAQVAATEAEVLTLAVHPGARGRGHGRALLRRLVAEAAERGARDLYLEVAADNSAALALYLAEGFQEVGRRRGYFRMPDGGRQDALVLHKAVAPEEVAAAAPRPAPATAKDSC
jgi:ribosomal-protein-alanine N-acetyltransferase